MKKISDYLDDAKKVTGSDYKTAQRLEVTRSAVSHMRKTNTIGNKYAPRLAELIGVHPGEIIAASDCETHPENRIYWERWVAVVAILAVGVGATFFDNSTGYETLAFLPGIHYAHSWIYPQIPCRACSTVNQGRYCWLN